MRIALAKSCRENQNTHFIFNKVFPKITSFKIMSKNVMEPEGPQMTLKYGAYSLHAG
jgi:hypothetical protein